ncbi:MAG: excinuclease ABC subunit UvrC [Candidatus Omnitrophica bacterium]|nr:excinuclease ABC subunit UvrC [Candidatus Omnitrophota bacterium]
MNKTLKEKVKQLPDACGVYLFKDAGGVVIYIGKAKSLRKRVQSYFARQLDGKTQVLVSKIADLEFRLTPSELQAELLEAALIKERQPHYNIDLKDDKSFPWIRFSNEEFPVVSVCRKKKTEKKGEALYIGPYTSADLLRQALKLIRRVFGFRSCRTMPKVPCLYFRLKLCPAPCAAKISASDYALVVAQIKLFLESRHQELIDKLARRMRELSADRKFEEAALVRDQINALAAISSSSTSTVALNELEDLRNLLSLKKIPARIEAFDISNFHGTSATGSMVSFLNGSADKNNYRRFRIKTVIGIDDYKMLAEVVGRRYSRLLNEGRLMPDLILIDGGKQHLAVALRELEKLGLEIPAASIAKEEENIYLPGKDAPLHLDSDTPALNLIRKVRDEAHRFAVSYHRLLRKKKALLKK